MNFFDKFLTWTADAALEALLAAAGLASMGGAYQPKEPENLHEVADKRRASAKRAK